MDTDAAQSNNSNSGVTGIVILTHGKLGEELVKSVEMIIGKIENVATLSLNLGEEPADFISKTSDILAGLPNNSLVLTDLFGGTPSNAAAALTQTNDIAVVSGVNLPMLIEAVSLRLVHKGSELADAVAAAGHDGIKNIQKLLMEQFRNAAAE